MSSPAPIPFAFGYKLLPVTAEHVGVLYLLENQFLTKGEGRTRLNLRNVVDAVAAAKVISMTGEGSEIIRRLKKQWRDRWTALRIAVSPSYFERNVKVIEQHLAPTLREVMTFIETKEKSDG